jgi:putative spermidine/putrescine transport system permease protein
MAGASTRNPGEARRRLRPASLGLLPFFLYTAAFLLIPTLIVIVGSFLNGNGGFTFANIQGLNTPDIRQAMYQSIVISVETAVIGGVVGGVLAYAVSTSKEGSLMRRAVTALCGVLAQFGGVALAFAFMATFGINGLITKWLSISDTGWLYQWNKGLVLVYLYFQIPLMFVVFLPAVEGLRAEWREATETLGGTTFTYWRRVAAPILLPSFIGALLLLFTSAFSAYATAAELISQGSPILPLQIAGSFTSETVLGAQNLGKAMALAMVVVVAIVMVIYTLVDRRAARWLKR